MPRLPLVEPVDEVEVAAADADDVFEPAAAEDATDTDWVTAEDQATLAIVAKVVDCLATVAAAGELAAATVVASALRDQPLPPPLLLFPPQCWFESTWLADAMVLAVTVMYSTDVSVAMLVVVHEVEIVSTAAAA